MTQFKIPVCRPLLIGKEQEYASRAVQSGWISSSGEFVEAFESAFGRFCNCGYGVACSNGTAAVYLALAAAGISAGDIVVVPSFTMMGSIFPILIRGAIPEFVDVDPETWTMNISDILAVRRRARAIIAVHIYGHPCDMDPIMTFASSRGITVIEDAAEAHGATYKSRPVGSLGHLAAFSFYANKIITCGEGGMVTTNQMKFADAARRFRNLGMRASGEDRFTHYDVSLNFRMTNVQAAIGLAQTENASALLACRRRTARKYLDRLAGLTHLLHLPTEKSWATSTYWMFGIVIREDVPIDANDVVAKMAAHGIETRRFFRPAHLQPALPSTLREGVHAPVSAMLWKKGLYLPSSGDLSDTEADVVADALKSSLA